MMRSLWMVVALTLVSPSFGAEGDSKYKGSKLTSDKTEKTADRRGLTLTTGRDRVVDLDFDANGGANGISIGNPKVVATTLVRIGSKRQLVFKPLGSGISTVTVRDKDGNVQVIFDVTVTGPHLSKLKSELDDLLKEIEGIQIRIVGDRIIVDGEVIVPQDYGRLYGVVTSPPYNEVVQNYATLSRLSLQIVSKRIQEDVNSFAPNVKTRVVNGLIWLEGTVDNLDQARRSAKVAELYLPQLKPSSPLAKDPNVQRLPPRSLIQNFIVINPPPPKKNEKIVRVTTHFVELSKDYQKAFGFRWRPGFTTDPQITIGTQQEGTVGASGLDTFTATISSLFPKLRTAQSAGFARVLKTGTVITRSGQPATFEEGTVVPIQVIGPNGQTGTQQFPTGFRVALTPLILGQSEDIQLDLDISQDFLTGRDNNGNPITSRRKVNSKIYVKSNESAAVAAMNSADVQTNFNKEPEGDFQGQTEPLFSLIRSKDYSKKKSQFVFFVTPQIVQDASEGTDDLKKNFRIKVK